MPDRRVMDCQVSALKKKVIDAGKGSAKANVEAAKAEAALTTQYHLDPITSI